MAHLRGDLQHKENLQTLHVNTAIQQLYSFVQVVLSGQWNHQLQGGGGEKKKEEKKNLKYSDLNNLINWVILFDHLWKCTQQQKQSTHRCFIDPISCSQHFLHSSVCHAVHSRGFMDSTRCNRKWHHFLRNTAPLVLLESDVSLCAFLYKFLRHVKLWLHHFKHFMIFNSIVVHHLSIMYRKKKLKHANL